MLCRGCRSVPAWSWEVEVASWNIGRKRIVHISGPADNVDAQQRREAFAAAIGKDAEPVVLAGNYSEESGAEAVSQLADKGIEFDALFAANDMMAIGAMEALRAVQEEAQSNLPALGYTVPYAVGNILLTAWGPVIVALMR